MELRIAGTVGESIVDGPGFRFTIFTQGCPHGCEGCHNPQTHDFNGGIVVDTDQLYNEIIKDPLREERVFCVLYSASKIANIPYCVSLLLPIHD